MNKLDDTALVSFMSSSVHLVLCCYVHLIYVQAASELMNWPLLYAYYLSSIAQLGGHNVLVLLLHLENSCFSFLPSLQPVASTINTLAGALYKVFSASPDQARNEMRQACFDYLSLGGVFSNGPVALLSGLNPRPMSLVCHFFAVAIYGVGRLMLPFPSPKRLWIGARLISVSHY